MKKKFSRILGVGLTLALLASLALVAVPVSALTQPSVSLDPAVTGDDISAIADYNIMFNLGKDLPDVDGTLGPGKIVIEFPTGTDLTGVSDTLDADVTIAATSGIGSVAFSGVQCASEKSPDTTTGPTLTITLPDILIPPLPDPDTFTKIGTGAMVQVVVSGVKNPDTPGDYTLDVSTEDSTAEIEAAVTSATYEIEAPTMVGLAGITSVYNPSDILMAQYTGDDAIANAIGDAGEDYTIMIGPGTYSSDTFITADDGVTFVSTGAVEDTIIEMDVRIDNADITLDGLTIVGGWQPAGAPVGTYITGDGVTIENCVFEKSSETLDEYLIVYDNNEATPSGDIVDCTIDTTYGTADDDVGIAVGDDGLTISGCTFLVDEDDVGVGVVDETDIEDSTFTGDSGVGVGVGGGVGTTIDGNTFDGLDNAITVEQYLTYPVPELVIKGNTITNSVKDAIVVNDTAELIIVNNTISDTDEDYYALAVEGNGDYVYLLFNNITGNELNVYNDSGGDVNATHNWWGDADGPDSDSITEDSGDVDTSAYLAASVTGAGAAVQATSLDAKTDAGVKVSTDATVAANGPEVMAAARYSDNPYTATPLDALADSFFDVYVSDPTAGTGDAEVITVKLYSGDVTNATVVYVWSELQGAWVECSDQGASPFGGYAWAKVEATETTPLFEDLEGIPFVLLESPEALVIFEIDLTAPQPGSTDVRITNTAFTWTSVAEADSYVWVLSAMADLSAPIERAFPLGTAYTYAGTLDYDTPYYWQVLASGAGDPVGESDVGTFTTAVEPVVPPALTYTCPQDGLVFTTPEALIEHWNLYHGPAAPTYTCPVDGLVFTTQEALAAHWDTYHAPAAEVTPAYIWVIIGVGAVLVIGVLVLIVRTRRVT